MVPGSPFQPTRGARGLPEDTRFRLFALTGPRSTAPNVVSPFFRSIGLLERGPAQGRGQTALLALGRLSRAIVLWPVIPRYHAPATARLAGGGFNQ